MSWQVGDTVESRATFTDKNGNLVNPSTVKFAFLKPGQTTETVWQYPADPQIVRDSIGRYHVELSLDVASAAKDWNCRWSGSGSGFARVKYFSVRVARPVLSSAP